MKITFCCTPNICWTLCESSSCTKPATYIVSFLSKAIFWLKNTQNLMFFCRKISYLYGLYTWAPEKPWDAHNYFGARTMNDARGSNDARTEWIAHLSTISPPRSYLAPVLAKGQTQVLIIGREGTLVWTLPKRTSPQPTRGDVGLKVYFRQFV